MKTESTPTIKSALKKSCVTFRLATRRLILGEAQKCMPVKFCNNYQGGLCKPFPGTRWSGIYLYSSTGKYARPTPYAPGKACAQAALQAITEFLWAYIFAITVGRHLTHFSKKRNIFPYARKNRPDSQTPPAVQTRPKRWHVQQL